MANHHKWVFVILSFLIIINCCVFIVAKSCYQESPTITNQTGIDTQNCNLNYSGVISYGVEYIYLNYSKPSNFLNATWLVKTESTTARNLTLPASCLTYNTNKLILRARGYSSDMTDWNVTWECYNGAWLILNTTSKATMPDTGGTSANGKCADGNWATGCAYDLIASGGWGSIDSYDPPNTAEFITEEAIWWNVTSAQTALTFNATSPQTYNALIIPSCSVLSGDGSAVLKINGTTIASGSTLNLAAGYYMFNCSLPQSENYSYTENISYFTINKKILSAQINAYPSWNLPAGSSVTVNFTESNSGDADVSYFLWRDILNKSDSDTWTPGLGTYQYKVNSSGGTNYTSNNSIANNILSVTNNVPTSTLIFPTNSVWTQNTLNNFNCSETDADGNLQNATLYLWESGVLIYTNTTNISGYSNLTNFTRGGVYGGTWKWNCLIFDSTSSSTFAASNYTLNVDTTNPLISYGNNNALNNTNFSRNWIFVNVSITENNFQNITFYLYNSSRQLVETDYYTALTSFQNFTSYANGVYYYNVTIYDKSGRVNSTETYKITLDTANPLISYNPTTETNATWLNRNFALINITSFDAYKSTVLLSWNGVNETFGTISNNYSWTNKTGLADGTYTFFAWVNDSAGNVNSTILRIIKLDATIPQIDWAGGIAGNATNNSQSFIYFNISKTETNCNKTVFYWRLLGGSWQSYNSSSCATSYNKTGLSDGIYQYYVLIVDNASNQNQTLTNTIGLDTTSPTLRIIFPVNSNVYNYHNQTLNFSASDSFGLSMCWKQLNTYANVTISCTANSTVNSTQGTIDGVNTIYLFANDTLGHLASTSAQYSISTGAPAVTLDSPGEGYQLNYKNNIYLNSTGTDADGISSYQIWGNWTGSWAMNYSNYSIISGVQNYIKINVLSDGIYKWNAWYNDTSGNGNYSLLNKTFIIDTTYPQIDFGTGIQANNTNISNNFIFVNVSLTEIHFGNITFSLYNSGYYSDTFTSLTTSDNFTALSDGIYWYNVTVFDVAGNVNNTLTRRITLDTTPPSITLINPTNSTYNSTLSQNFTANFSDNLGLKNATLYVYNTTGLENSSDISSFAENVTSSQRGAVIVLTQGNKTWFYKAWDWAGNSFISDNNTIFVDSIVPEVVNAGYNPSTIYNETNVRILGNITSATMVWLEINITGTYQNITITNVSGNQYSYNLSNSLTNNNQNISWKWWANDSAGNLNQSSLNYFVISNRAPYSLIVTPGNNSFTSNSFFTITFSATDDDYDTLSYYTFYGNNTLFNITTSSSTNFTGFGSVNTFYVIASDGNLNVSVVNYTFTPDTIKPNLILYIPLPSPTVQCSLASISLNISANDTNLNYCSYNVTYGSFTSTPNTIFDCNPTYFNVGYDNSVQLLSVSVFDYAGNVNTTTRYLYFNTASSSCSTPISPGGGGGTDTPPVDYGFCGDGVCQDGNDGNLDRGEDFYGCAIDCSKVKFNLNNINGQTLITNCFSSDEAIKDRCIWNTKPGLLTLFILVALVLFFSIFFSIKSDSTGTRKIIYNTKFFKRRRK